MSFRIVNRDDGRYRLLPAANAITFVKGEAMADDGNGLLTNASSSSAIVKYIAEENVLTAASGQLVLCYKVDESVLINADCDAAAAQTDVHTYADLATKSTVNPDASTVDVFYIESIDLSGGAVGTSTRINGYFVNGEVNT